MSDIRQEAVERAGAALYRMNGPVDTLLTNRQAYAAIDASGLIEQLSEAIAQRDNAANVNGYYANEAFKAREQLAAERALSDRLARQYQTHVAYSCWWQADADVLADYRAFRTTERANTEKGGHGDV